MSTITARSVVPITEICPNCKGEMTINAMHLCRFRAAVGYSCFAKSRGNVFRFPDEDCSRSKPEPLFCRRISASASYGRGSLFADGPALF
jgi:hypothetical protein